MARISTGRGGAKDEVEKFAAKTAKAAETRGGRRTAPKDAGPPSPAQIAKLYSGLNAPGANHADGDGLVSSKQHRDEVAVRRPQNDIDGHLAGYGGEVPSGSWLRGGGKQGAGKPGFVAIGIPGPAKGGGKCQASGADAERSPFSAAHKTSHRKG